LILNAEKSIEIKRTEKEREGRRGRKRRR